MIGGWQYLTHTTLEIENVVSIGEKFQEDPKKRFSLEKDWFVG